MGKLKSKRGILAISALCAVFGVFAVFAFVQSQDVIAGNAEQSETGTKAGACPYSQGAKTEKTSGMPGSCSELHKEALASGKMSNEEFAKAEVLVASLHSDESQLTPEQCRELMAGLGFECNEKDIKACAEKLKSLGFCKESTVEQCAAQLAKGVSKPLKGSLCEHLKADGGCCAKTAAVKVGVGDQEGVEVSTAVATEKSCDAAKAKQCDISKGSCATMKKASDN